MTDYPQWAGRLSACLESLLDDTPSQTVAEVQREVATETLAEYREATRIDRTVSPLGDRRERSVRCWHCWGQETFNIHAVCDDCAEAAADVRTTGDAS